ncbi:hypothetical protein PMIN01_11988 [Paraphaeosphaeria minitans]|uniref:Uncharacterized protein n=1 Tax=Paraphaeosphaeria minitans TaxID=565426 RepID=A0A9P6G914_9PLEO|nr:hypothetical protein PMIN01_11988 [Paraphaeosphaeria minitans]
MCSRFRPTAKGFNAKAAPSLALGGCASSGAESSSSVLMAYLNVCVSRFPRIPSTSENHRRDDNTSQYFSCPAAARLLPICILQLASKADLSKTPNEESHFC